MTGTPNSITLRHRDSGIAARFLAHGCTLVELSRGEQSFLATLSCDSAYPGNAAFAGTVIGRVANRIAGGRFEVEGTRYATPQNDGPNTLHGGPCGFHMKAWNIRKIGADEAVFTYVSPDGEMGFPGRLHAQIRARVGASGLTLDYEAITTAATPVSLTHHPYFRLPGATGADDMALRTAADSFSATGPDDIPTRYASSVTDTPFDFREARIVGATTIDHSFNSGGSGLRPVAELLSKRARLSVASTLPAVQVYTGDALDTVGLERRAGLAIEPQYPPNWVNAGEEARRALPHIGPVILQPGETYRHTTAYRLDLA